MKKFVTVVCACALLVNLSGCGGTLKGEPEMKEMISAMEQASDAKDPAKALEAAGKVIAAAKKLEDLKLTKDEKDKLEAKYKSKIEELEKKMKKGQ